MPLSTDELKDPARVDLRKSVEGALRHPMPAAPDEPRSLDAVIEKCIVDAMRRIESGFSDLDRALARKGMRSVATAAPARTSPLQKSAEPRSVWKCGVVATHEHETKTEAERCGEPNSPPATKIAAHEDTRTLLKVALRNPIQTVPGAKR